MKKFILLAVMLLSFVFANAQSVFITEQNYQNLKANGQLLPNVDYKFINSPSNTAYQQSHSQVINQSVTGSTAKTNSATACQCMVPVDPTFTLVPMFTFWAMLFIIKDKKDKISNAFFIIDYCIWRIKIYTIFFLRKFYTMKLTFSIYAIRRYGI